MPSLTTIRGLNEKECAMIQNYFIGTYLTEPEYHPSVIGCWFQVYNQVTEDVMIIDKSTTVEQLHQVLGK